MSNTPARARNRSTSRNRCRTTTALNTRRNSNTAGGPALSNGDYFGDGYGLPTEGMIEAVKMLASYEGILLDPVYAGKGFAGLLDLVRQGHFKAGENVVFLHTGGSVSLFAYPKIFELPDYD